MIKKIQFIIFFFANMLVCSKVFAEDMGDPLKFKEAMTGANFDYNEIINPVLIIMLFLSIISIGFNVIIFRNKKEERSSAMMGLFYIAIGAAIVSSAGLIYKLIMELM